MQPNEYPRISVSGITGVKRLCITCLQDAEQARHTISDCVHAIGELWNRLKIEESKQ